jgi:hypothetical protein
MRSGCRQLLLLVLCFPVLAGWAQTPSSGQMVGNWKLNVKLSNFGTAADTAPKAILLNVTSDTPDLVAFQTTYTSANGMQFTWKFSGPADGKDHAADGTATTYAYTHDGDTVTETQKDTDGTLTKGTFTLSANKKLGTWNYTITDPQGAITTQKMVFDRVP